jgi:hypothetical protein
MRLRYLILVAFLVASPLLIAPAFAQTLSTPQRWYVRGLCWPQGVVYNLEPGMEAKTASNARKPAEAALRAVLTCLGRDPNGAIPIMKNVSLTAASYRKKRNQEIWREGGNYIVVVFSEGALK